MATSPVLRVPLDEYLRMDDDDPDGRRWEYHDGDVFEVEAATPAHGAIVMNLGAVLHNLLRERACIVRGGDLRVRVLRSYLHPDVTVSCDPEQFDRGSLLNPLLIVEVQSPTTEDFVHGNKFKAYRTIPSFREYLIVAQDEIYVEQHVRGDSFWTMREYYDMNGDVPLASLDVLLPIREIYAKIEFTREALQS